MPSLHVDQGGKMQQSMVLNNLRVAGFQLAPHIVQAVTLEFMK